MPETGEPKATKKDTDKELENDRLGLEIKRYEFEKYKYEQEQSLEVKRYALERYKTRHEHRFLSRNLGVLISAAISLSAVLVSLGQVWVAKISKEKELAVASLQKQADNERLDKQRDKELALQVAERERQWNLDRAKFITENKKTIFEGNPQELKRMSMVIETLFPYDIAAGMFEDLKRAADSPDKERVWSGAQERLQKRSNASSDTPPPVVTDGNNSPPAISTAEAAQIVLSAIRQVSGSAATSNGSLEDNGLLSDNLTSMFREHVINELTSKGITIDRSQIPAEPATKVRSVISSVVRNSRRSPAQ
jgi:hypothetical protein